MINTDKAWGVFCAIIAGVSYGTNPLGGLIMYGEGFNPSSVIFLSLYPGYRMFCRSYAHERDQL